MSDVPGFARSTWWKVRHKLGYDDRNWLRVRQIDAWEEFLRKRPAGDILEVSPGWESRWSKVDSDSYTAVAYPEFDITRDTLDKKFDIVIADQVLEHVADPERAITNMRAMVKPGGYAMIATPFLFRVHARPHDFYRWTEGGLRHALERAGFQSNDIQTEAWGNQACARAHIGGPVHDMGFGREMKNDPEYPIMVWAFVKNG